MAAPRPMPAGTAQRRPGGRRLIVEWALVAGLSSLAIVLAVLGGWAERADNLVYDLMAKGARHAPSDDIVLVAIDNRSLRELGRWPWPRARHAELLRRLARMGPKAIAYDVLFVDPDPDPAADAALAQAARAAGRVALPVTFEVPGDNGAPFRRVLPVEPLRRAAAGLGHVNLQFDPDGVVRRAVLAEDDGTTVWPQLMETAFRLAAGRPSPLWSAGGGRAPQRNGGLFRSRPMMIPFAGPPGSFRAIAFSDLLRGETPEAFVRGKIVLVGATADGLGDRYATPLSGGQEVMSGIEVQANVLDALLRGRAVRPAGPAVMALASLAPLWILLAGFLTLRPRANMALGAGLAAATLLASAAALKAFGLWLAPSAAVLGLLLVYPFWSWRRLEAASAYMLEELERFAGEPGLLPALAAPDGRGGEVVTREVGLMRAAVGRMRDLRRFVDDTLQGLPDATLVVDPTGAVTLANRAARRLFQDLGGPEPEGRPIEALLARLERAEAEAEDEATAAGRAYQLRREALRSADGRPLGEIVRLTDITALRAAARQREQVLQLLTHDMRSPQVSILALLDGPGEARPPAALAGRIAGYARRTLALADAFVHLARAESAALAREPLDLGDLMVEAADDLWPQASAKSVALAAAAPDGEHLVLGDRSLLSRALINLVGNAVKYTDPGGRVEGRVWREDGEIVCAVSDTGRGLEPEALARLFERFHRGAAPRGSDGAGLGLAFVHTVVERHGGRIACDSVPGRGTTFTIRLAAAEAPSEG